VKAYRFAHNNVNYVLIDTPGFNDSSTSDEDTIAKIISWLESSYHTGTRLSSIVYVHSIAQARMSGSAHKNMRFFRKLVDQDALSNIVLATSFWDQVSPETGASRERQLETSPEFWASMYAKGSEILRISQDRATCLQVLERIVARVRATPGHEITFKDTAVSDSTSSSQKLALAAKLAMEKQAVKDDFRRQLEKRESENRAWKARLQAQQDEHQRQEEQWQREEQKALKREKRRLKEERDRDRREAQKRDEERYAICLQQEEQKRQCEEQRRYQAQLQAQQLQAQYKRELEKQRQREAQVLLEAQAGAARRLQREREVQQKAQEQRMREEQTRRERERQAQQEAYEQRTREEQSLRERQRKPSYVLPVTSARMTKSFADCEHDARGDACFCWRREEEAKQRTMLGLDFAPPAISLNYDFASANDNSGECVHSARGAACFCNRDNWRRMDY
jgi:hypothetical protein